jgi:MSHA pilin protein MshD
MCARHRSAGFSLIEVVVFIVVLGIAFVGMLILYNRVTSASVDPIVRKQALAIASSLLEEIELRAYTFCETSDPNVYTAANPAGCTTVEAKVAGENRYNPPRYDNVKDYDGFCMGPGLPACPDAVIRTAAGTTLAELANYRADVAVVQIAANELLATAGDNVPTTDALRVTVTAIHLPTGIATSLQGYRVRYAPNSP